MWWRCRGGKQGGGDDACLASAEQEAAAVQERIRIKRTRCGELEMAVRQGKDAFVSASSSCAVAVSPPFPDTTASPLKYHCLLSSLPSWCLLPSPSPTPPLLPVTSSCHQCYLLLSSTLPPRTAASYAPHLCARRRCNPRTECRDLRGIKQMPDGHR